MLVNQYPTGVVLVPYPELKDRFALTAWQRIDKFDNLDEKRINDFIKTYHGIDHHTK
jgi:hypothetical protein